VALGRGPAGVDVNALVQGVLDFGGLRHLGQRRHGVKTPVVHVIGPGPALPADLLDAVVQLDHVVVWVEEVDLPVAAGHVASRPADLHTPLPQVRLGVHHLLQAAYLPGDLAERNVLRLPVVAVEGAEGAVRQQQRVVIGGVAGEDQPRIGDDLLDKVAGLLGHLVEHVQVIGDAESEDVGVEGDRVVEPLQVQADVAKAPDLERTGEKDSADVVLSGCCGGHDWSAFSLAWLLSSG
jgi:hypothetical protein